MTTTAPYDGHHQILPPGEPPPARSRARRFLLGLRTMTVALLLVAAAGFGGLAIARHRTAATTDMDLGDAVLDAQPVPVGTPQAAVVTRVLVTEHSRVSAGQPLAQVSVTPADPSDPPVAKALRAPVSGLVVRVDVPVGGIAQPGQPVLTLYDHTKLTFEVDVPVSHLQKLRQGMAAHLSGSGLPHRVPATLDHVVPAVDAAPGRTDQLTIVLVPDPAEAATVSSLVPGLSFDATVDTTTAPGGTPLINSAR